MCAPAQLSSNHQRLMANTQHGHACVRACGGSFRGLWFIAVIRGFCDLMFEQIASVFLGEDGAVQHVSSHRSQQWDSTPVQPVKLSELDYVKFQYIRMI